jgi:hypothetical protein
VLTVFNWSDEPLTRVIDLASMDGLKVQHTFTHPGEYQVQATVTGLGGIANRKASKVSITGDVSTRFEPAAMRRSLPLQ